MAFDVKSDFQTDVSPSTWLKPYSNNSIKHVLKMAIFYHILGIMFASLIAGTFFVVDPDYEPPYTPLYLVDLITAGPIEESIFFGLPFYITGNQYVMLGAGIVWSLGHIGGLDENLEFSPDYFTWDNFAFVILSLFFSYRTWITGFGWLSILLHSAWNGMVFGFQCGFENSCSVTGDTTVEVVISNSMIVLSIILLLITYWAYRRRKQKNYKSNISKLQSSARKLFDETQEKISEGEKRCANCNRLLSEYYEKKLCYSCGSQEKTS